MTEKILRVLGIYPGCVEHGGVGVAKLVQCACQANGLPVAVYHLLQGFLFREAVWEEYTSLHSNKVFKGMVNQRKAELAKSYIKVEAR